MSPMSDVMPDLETSAKVFRSCLASKLGCVLVSEHGGRITGTVIGVAQEWWWCRKRVASDLLLYAERPGDGIALLRAFMDWAWKVPGVIHVMCSQSSGIEVMRTARIYERAGLKMIGGMYLASRPQQVEERAA